MKKSRKILAGFLAVSLLAAGVPVITAGQPDCFSIVASAVDGAGTYVDPWKIGKVNSDYVTAWLEGEGDNKTLKIIGTGAMLDFSPINTPPWYSESTKIKTIDISSGMSGGMTNIGDHAFEDCSNLTSVTIPGSVTSIGDYTFYNCGNLTSVTIPDNVTSIGEYAFAYCFLTDVTIPKNVTRIDIGAFYNCSDLSTVTFECGTADTDLEIGTYVSAGTATNAKLDYGTGNTRLFDGNTEITAGTLLTLLHGKTLKWKTVAAPVPAAVYTPVPASAPTCTESGNIAYYIGDDGKYYLDADGNTETTPANVTIPATGHDWGEWVTLKEPTYYETGLRQRICSNDPTHIETEEIPVKGIEYFTVSFNTAGGNYVSSQTVQGGKIAARPADPTRNGYTFRYWTLNGSAYNFDRPVMENLTLTAVWEQNPVTAAGSSNALIPFTGRYGINYNLDGGTNSPENPSYYNRGEGTSLAPAYKEGYVFEGWYLDSDFTKPIYSISDIQSGKVILYAKFTPDSSVKPVVTAKVSENGDVELSWDSVNGAEKYKIFRYVNGKLRSIASTENTSYTISGESGENTYAVKALKNGEWTEIYKSDLVTVNA